MIVITVIAVSMTMTRTSLMMNTRDHMILLVTRVLITATITADLVTDSREGALQK